jgi:hypothetical protein
VTTPLRTLLDLAAVLAQAELERAIRQAVYRRLTTTALLAEAVHQRAGKRGVKAVRTALIHRGEAPGVTRSARMRLDSARRGATRPCLGE